MSKKPYVVTESDLDFVVDWVSRQLRKGQIVLLDDNGKHDFDKAWAMQKAWESCDKNEAQGLHEWCEHWLSETDWTRLKTTIRQKRLKTSSRLINEPLKNVNLKQATWQRLTRLKKKLGLDHSGAIDFLITEYNRNNKATK